MPALNVSKKVIWLENVLIKAAAEVMDNLEEGALIVVKMGTCPENVPNLKRKEVADDLKSVSNATSSVTCHVTVPHKAMKVSRDKEWTTGIR